MEFKRRKKKISDKKPNYSFRAFLIAMLAFFGISAGSDILPDEVWDFLGVTHSTTESTAEESPHNRSANTTSGNADTFRVHILDVGQGLSVFIDAGEDSLLYDGGGADTSSFVVSYLQMQDVENLDYCIASHYDADHLSGIVGALNAFDVETLIAPDYKYDTKTYYSFLSTAEKKDFAIHYPTASETFPFGDGHIQILAPLGTGYEDDNDYSVVVKVTIGESTLLLTGDASSASEEEMLEADMDLNADVLVLGHHGSYSSTGEDFFRAVSPDYTVISCGKNNDYGHPHRRIMDLLGNSTAHLYRTDLQGTICVTMTAEKIVFDEKPCTDYSTGDEVRYKNYNAK